MLYEVLKSEEAWWWLFPAITAMSGFAGGIFGSFFSKRGEIAAIQSQIETVVRQNDQLVKNSEEIKSDISQRDWSKQQRWDMQRDVGIEIMRLFGTTLKTVGRFRDLSAYQESIQDERKKVTKEQEKETWDEYVKTMEEMRENISSYCQLGEVSRLVFSSRIQSRLEQVREGYRNMLNAIWAFEMIEGEKYGPRMEEIIAHEESLALAIRDELGFGSTPA